MADSELLKQEISLPLDKKEYSIGRDSPCSVRIGGIGVSRQHAKIRVENDRSIWIHDGENTSGIRINGKPVQSQRLASGDELTLGVNKLSIAIGSSAITISRITEPEQCEPAQETAQPSAILLGRDPSNTIALNHPMVSRFHATLTKTNGGEFIIEDHASTNGTFVNGKAVRSARLFDGDIVIIGPYRYYLDAGKLLPARDSNRIKIEAFGISVVKNGSTLIDDVSLSIEPGEFVAILGPSGAGKSTLAHALLGTAPLSKGLVFYNGLHLKDFVEAYRSAIGFVTQENLLRGELTVQETLCEQCLLRLPKDSSRAERVERVREVMELLDLTDLAKRRVGTISGGEAKRVHFGIELLSSPTLIFLDEPFAGLDPGLIRKFMELFRNVCNKGHSLLLTTHTLEHIELCNRIMFLSGGKLLFSGTAEDLKSRYGVASLAQVYEQERDALRHIRPVRPKKHRPEKNANVWPHRKFPGPRADKSMYKPRTIGLVAQIATLCKRYFKISVRDTRNILLMLFQAPLIALVLSCTFKSDDNYFPIPFYFCLSLSAIWMGGMNSIREIAGEWSVIEHEFRIGLSQGAYLASKIVVFGAFSALQSVLFGFCIALFFKEFSLTPEIVLLLTIAGISGTILGLCVSVLSKNVTIAISWLPIIFIPQIFFSGIMVPFDEMSALGRFLSNLTMARPIFSMFKKMCFLDQALWSLSEWRALFFLCIGLIILMIVAMRIKRVAP